LFITAPSLAGIKKYRTLYGRHFGITLTEAEAEKRLSALIGLLAAACEGASACGAAHGGAAQDCAAVRRCSSSGHRESNTVTS